MSAYLVFKKMKFKTKAQNLKILKNNNLKTPHFIFFKLKDFNKDNKKYIKIIQKKLGDKVAVRSSNYYEDQFKTTLAGKFVSLLNIESKKENNLINAIDKVACS